MRDEPLEQKNLLTFKSGGWVLVLTALLAVVVAAITLVPALRQHANRPPGDGTNPDSYGFDLSTCLVPRDELVAGLEYRDLNPSLTDPQVMPADGVTKFNEEHRGKYLVSGDRVIGVSINGESRAYPLVLMNQHEIANDVLGGQPIVVSYNWLCDSIMVAGRIVAGETLEFGVSGLLHDHNLLMYDRRENMVGESLWSQLQRRAITGPAAQAERALELIPAELTHWADWLARHPDTTVLEPDPSRWKRYKETNYERYFQSDELLFPVDPLPPAEMIPAKTPCVVVFSEDERRLYPLPVVAELCASNGGSWTDTIEKESFTFHAFQDPLAVRVEHASTPEPARVIYCFWFAWYAMEPGVDVFGVARTTDASRSRSRR